MFVIYKVEFNKEISYEKVQEVRTLDEAEVFLNEHKDDGNSYTVMME